MHPARIETATCLAAMIAGAALDLTRLPLSSSLCAAGGTIGDTVRLHLALFPAMHAGMALAVAGACLAHARRPRPLARCAAALMAALCLFAGMHLGGSAAAAMRLGAGWWPMLAGMMLGMQAGAWLCERLGSTGIARAGSRALPKRSAAIASS